MGATRKLTLADAEPIARAATKAALEGARELTAEERGRLTLTSVDEGSAFVFHLYLAGEKRADALIISSATVDRTTGAVEVQVQQY